MKNCETAQNQTVLIVGGGIVGLSAALFLQHHGVPFTLVEQGAELSALPRARGFSARTLELYRSIGLQGPIERVAATAWKQGAFGGARRGRSLLESEPLPLADIGKLHTYADPSPCQLTACPQTLVEPVLLAALRERGGDMRFSARLVRFEQDDQCVRAVIRNSDASETRIDAGYLFAADGARSEIRRSLGIARQGIEPNRHYLNVYFEADLTTDVAGRTFSQCEVANGIVSGVFLAMNNTTRWSFHISYDPSSEDPERWSESQIISMIQAAIGYDLPVRLLQRSAWNTRVRTADSYRVGRCFLMGDAAHTMPPWGGFNANTGIADAYDLAWRIAYVLKGQESPSILNFYEKERRPVAIRNGEQAWLRTDFEARFQIQTAANAQTHARLIDYGALQMRYRYGANDTVDALRAQPGTRFPHTWIEWKGERHSTLDLFGRSYVAVCGPSAEKLADVVSYRVGDDFRFLEEGFDWRQLTGLENDGVVMVRPDGIVSAVNLDS
ncbi:FAD-dependent monooxygenase [Pseudomonas sp. R76]|uniref:FAD-dependent monooxygenase n=1 Tax=Pseudomonas sp. R76 TaxID=1573711 RepID=UPI00131FBC8F|nr:FAD-dependent monooxygenase [Pseudomonas sp. R76]QHD06948.1 hypothetical protein PspR76_14960 [Pseudomonas sp. R76]